MRDRRCMMKMQSRGKKNGKNQKAPTCPYCGRTSVLRPATYVYGEHTLEAGSYLYVCSGYPACGAYVGVHDGTKRAKGTLANSELRNKRIRAHRLLEQIVKSGCMTKDGIYVWLSSRFSIPYDETHIGYFSDYLCGEVIKECEGVLARWQKQQSAA